MTIRYEINPPKITDPPSRIDLLDERIEQISKYCDGIHVTDSVLGIERISPLIIGTDIKQKHPELQVTISLRVIDKNIWDEIIQSPTKNNKYIGSIKDT